MDPTRDWLLRTIYTLGQSFETASTKGTRTMIPRPNNAVSDDDLLPEILKEMVQAGKLDEAENLLFRCVENYPLNENYMLGLKFYASLTELSDAELADAGWSRKEIKEGIRDLHYLIFGEYPQIDTEDLQKIEAKEIHK